MKLGMHGFGYIGKVHMLALQTALLQSSNRPDVIWSDSFVRTLDSEAGVLAQNAFQRVHDTVTREVLDGLDAIDVVSPNNAHPAVVQAAAEAGVHVYCEKPLSHDLEQSRHMAEEVESAGITHQVALLNRFHPAVEQAWRLLKSGVMGDVLTFRASLLHGGYLSTRRPMSWRLRHEDSGGGAIVDLGVHMIDLVHMLLGKITSVKADLRTFVTERPVAGQPTASRVDVDDWGLLRVTLAGGATGTIEVSRVHFEAEQNDMVIVCRNGTLSIQLSEYAPLKVHLVDGLRDEARTVAAAAISAETAPLASFRLPAKFHTDAFLNLHAAGLLTFLHRIQGGDVDYPLPTFTEAVTAEEVVFAAMESSRNHGLEQSLL